MTIMAKANEVAMPNLRLRKKAMWSEQFQHQSNIITKNTPDQQPYWLQSQCHSRSSHEMSSTSTMRNYNSNRGSKLHDVWKLLHVGCHSSPLPTQDLVPRSKHGKARDTQNGDDLHAPMLPPSPSDVPTAP